MQVILVILAIAALVFAGTRKRADAILLGIAGVLLTLGVLHNTLALRDDLVTYDKDGKFVITMSNPWISNYYELVFEGWFYLGGIFLVAALVVYFLRRRKERRAPQPAVGQGADDGYGLKPVPGSGASQTG
jgi:hypothetical protein